MRKDRMGEKLKGCILVYGPEKLQKPWHMGTHLEVLNESYSMNTNIARFRWFSKIFASFSFVRK